MIGWSRALNPEQVEAVRAYVSHQARLKMQQGDPRPTRELDRVTAAVADQ
jgi:hypothetical protein